MGTTSALLEVVAERAVLFDGAMGTQIQAANLASADFGLRSVSLESARAKIARLPDPDALLDGCNELLNLTRPEEIEAIHAKYLRAGSDILTTNTFGASSVVLAEYGIESLLHEVSFEAGRIARRVADAFSTPERPRFVAGAIGPGTKLVSLEQATFDEIEQSYFTAFVALIEAGVDALMLETLQDLLMAKACIVGAHRALAESDKDLPILVSVTIEQTGTMLLGSEIGAALNMLEAFPQVKMVGINCATGPVEMAPHVRFLCQNSTRPVFVQPNAGLPVMERGQAVYRLSPEELASSHSHFLRDMGVAAVGGCCGTTPEHIAAVSQALADAPRSPEAHWQKVRVLFPGFDFRVRNEQQCDAVRLVGSSSLFRFQPYRQDTSFLIIGEKTNANGSKAFREMLAAENWDGLTELARELEAEGSHMLDVCAAFVGRDETRDMRILLTRFNKQVSVPLMIDSTDAKVIEEALKTLAGKPLVNSINFEDGEERTRIVLGLCAQYGAGVVALTIDEEGMAKTAERKVAIADRILAFTREAGLPDHDVFLDCLTFTLGSGDEEFRRSAAETLEAIRALRSRNRHVNLLLGVSNVSFGLKPALRNVLNTVFLQEALGVGLNAAIVHFSKIRPLNQIEPDLMKIAQDLIYDRRQFATV